MNILIKSFVIASTSGSEKKYTLKKDIIFSKHFFVIFSVIKVDKSFKFMPHVVLELFKIELVVGKNDFLT